MVPSLKSMSIGLGMEFNQGKYKQGWVLRGRFDHRHLRI